MDEMEVVVEKKLVRVPIKGLEHYYEGFVNDKATLRERLEKELEERFAVESERYDKLIEYSSELVEVEVEPEVVDLDEENTETVE